MACYTHCTGHCYNDQCLTYDAANEVYDYGVKWPSAAGSKIHDENIEQLRLSINDERLRRNNNAGEPAFAPSVWTPSPIDGSDEVTPGDIIYGENAGTNEAIKELRASVNEMRSGYITFSVIDGNTVTYDQINELRTKLDDLRAECLCNTDCGADSVCSCYTNCGCKYGGSSCETNVPCVTY